MQVRFGGQCFAAFVEPYEAVAATAYMHMQH